MAAARAEGWGPQGSAGCPAGPRGTASGPPGCVPRRSVQPGAVTCGLCLSRLSSTLLSGASDLEEGAGGSSLDLCPPALQGRHADAPGTRRRAAGAGSGTAAGRGARGWQRLQAPRMVGSRAHGCSLEAPGREGVGLAQMWSLPGVAGTLRPRGPAALRTGPGPALHTGPRGAAPRRPTQFLRPPRQHPGLCHRLRGHVPERAGPTPEHHALDLCGPSHTQVFSVNTENVNSRGVFLVTCFPPACLPVTTRCMTHTTTHNIQLRHQ